MTVEERLTEIERRLDALDAKEHVGVVVRVTGVVDAKMRDLARKGVVDAMRQYEARKG